MQCTVTWSWCSVTLREELMGRISASSRFPPETTTEEAVSSWYSLQCPTPLTTPPQEDFLGWLQTQLRGPTYLYFLHLSFTAQIQLWAFARNHVPMWLAVHSSTCSSVQSSPGPMSQIVPTRTVPLCPVLQAPPSTVKSPESLRSGHPMAPTALSL